MENTFKIVTKRIRVYGIVQGVGFRPTVSRHAMTSGVTGNVSNKGPFVEIFVQGSEEQTEYFLSLLKTSPPKRAVILKLDVSIVPDEEAHVYKDFAIIESNRTKGEIFISPDIAICDDCKRELYTPVDKRYHHPFINCTCCGPRLTILDALPYDRERTSMKEFPMCPDCSKEYYDPATRRYDAQPVCCNKCGPEVYELKKDGSMGLRGKEAITKLREVILSGGIAAIKGIGGFHLCCNGENEEAVMLLRQRKTRPAKPFAVMMRNIETVERECMVPDFVKEILTGHQKPITLLPKKAGSRIAPSVAPDNLKVGGLIATILFTVFEVVLNIVFIFLSSLYFFIFFLALDRAFSLISDAIMFKFLLFSNRYISNRP